VSVFRRDRLADEPPAPPAGASTGEGGGALLGGTDEIRPWLMPRVLRKEQAAQAGDVIGFAVGGELFAVLGAQGPDGPDSLFAVGNADADRLGVSSQQLWAWGLENLRNDPATVRPVNATAGGQLNAVLAKSTYGATHVLRLNELLGEPAPYGALVTVPHVSTLIYLVLRSHVDMRMVPYLMYLVAELQQGDGNALSSELYWWTPEGIEAQGVQLQGERAQLSVTPRFREMLQTLPQS
jgi:hypothetical protein